MGYETITSRDNAAVKNACRLAALPAERRSQGLFFAEGVRLCLDLARTLTPDTVFFTERVLEKHPEAAGLCDKSFLVAPHVAEKLSETRQNQGLFCLFPLPAGGIEALDAARGVVVCEAVQDPSNLGAILRSAAAFGFGGVVLTPGCADPFGPKALRASVGAAARLPVAADVPLTEAARQLKAQGLPMWAAALEGGVPLEELHPAGPVALLVGNEGAGLSEQALALSDGRVYIPMQGGVESLNAAVAAGVLMYALKGRGAHG